MSSTYVLIFTLATGAHPLYTRYGDLLGIISWLKTMTESRSVKLLVGPVLLH